MRSQYKMGIYWIIIIRWHCLSFFTQSLFFQHSTGKWLRSIWWLMTGNFSFYWSIDELSLMRESKYPDGYTIKSRKIKYEKYTRKANPTHVRFFVHTSITNCNEWRRVQAKFETISSYNRENFVWIHETVYQYNVSMFFKQHQLLVIIYVKSQKNLHKLINTQHEHEHEFTLLPPSTIFKIGLKKKELLS